MRHVTKIVMVATVVTSGLLACNAPTGDGTTLAVHYETRVRAGAESFECAYLRPADGREDVLVRGASVSFTGTTHHVVVYRTNRARIPDGGDRLQECAPDWSDGITGYYFEAQSSGSRRDMPPGVAHRFGKDEVLLLQAHYVNAGADEQRPTLDFALDRADAKDVSDEAGTIFFYDQKIHVPAHARARVQVTCPVREEVHLVSLWSHMHARGIGFEATLSAPGQASPRSLYATGSWTDPQPASFVGDDATVPAGSSISFSCSYENDDDGDVVMGPSALTNEMCVLHGLYWPRRALSFEMCDVGVTDATGDASAMETWSCINRCAWGGDDACRARCWDAACAGASMPVGALTRCMHTDDTCSVLCTIPTTADCDQCLRDRCPAEYGLVAGASCAP